jgi:two-component system, response regulator
MIAAQAEILLVEDNTSDLELTLHAFQRGGFANRVDTVRDGAEALEFVFQSGRYASRVGVTLPRVILLDLKLPLVDGIEVLRRLKADERSRRIPVVVLTSSSEDRDLRECYELGVNSYIVKPVDIERFFQAVQQLGMYWLLLNEHP